MSITATISKPLGQGYVQVDSETKGGYKRYYKVSHKNAKRFATELVKQDKEMNLYSNIVFFTSIFTGVLGATFFTKNMDSRVKQFLVQSASAVVLASLSTLGMNGFIKNEENNLMKTYKAKEIYYRA